MKTNDSEVKINFFFFFQNILKTENKFAKKKKKKDIKKKKLFGTKETQKSFTMFSRFKKQWSLSLIAVCFWKAFTCFEELLFFWLRLILP